MASIIIAEDDPMISEIYEKKFFEAGFEVLLADSGEQVLTLAKKNKVDVILLDLLLPRMDGFEVIRSLRTNQFSPEIKIIVFSNLSQKEDREKAMKLGADGFIVKAEYTPSALVKEVERLLNQYSEEKKNGLREEAEKNGAPFLADHVAESKNVLMIEDEEIFIEIFGDKLKQDGYQFSFSTNGSEGLKMALTGEYDLFIIDVVLPGIPGNEIIEKLKMEDRTKDTPIIVFSASVDDITQGHIEKTGIEAFYIKTQLVPSELSKKVSEILFKNT
jgi:CheY-like chemotaxis protein